MLIPATVAEMGTPRCPYPAQVWCRPWFALPLCSTTSLWQCRTWNTIPRGRVGSLGWPVLCNEVLWLGLEGSGSLSGEGSRHQLWCPTQLWSPWYKGTWQATESDPRRSSREVTQTAAVSGTANENHARFLDFSNRSLNTPGWKIDEQKKSLYPGFQSAQSLTA